MSPTRAAQTSWAAPTVTPEAGVHALGRWHGEIESVVGGEQDAPLAAADPGDLVPLVGREVEDAVADRVLA